MNDMQVEVLRSESRLKEKVVARVRASNGVVGGSTLL
jgi:hypothetical protein